MSVEQRAYLDTSALAKWYLNEVGSEAFVDAEPQSPHGRSFG
jgi:predicted nucleic acid-binding protein